jgi:signal transduction histidine kinase/ligand-binding sensor domain-containing protein
MRALPLLAAAAVLLCAATAGAQVYRFRTYTSNSGLPSNATYAVYQDARGYIWFATDGGACRYDGQGYQTFSVTQGLADASVRGFVEDKGGDLWMLTKGGLSRFDGHSFHNYTTAQGLPSDEVRAGLRTRDGMLWFGTARGLARWDGTRFTTMDSALGLPAAPVWSLHEDAAGALWVGLRGGGLARLEDGRFRVFGTASGLPSQNVFGISDDGTGGLWLATDGGLVHREGENFRTYTTADGLGSNEVSSVLVDRHGRVWCGTFGGGISRLENGRFTTFKRRNGVPDEYVTSIFKDSEDDLWFGSLWSGAFRFASERFATYSASAGLGEGLITGIGQAPDGTLWFSSINDGVAAMGPGGVRRWGRAEGLADERIWALYVSPAGRVWMGGLRGAALLENGHLRNFTAAEMGATDRLNAVVEDAQGTAWFGSGAARSAGVIAYDGRRFVTHGLASGLAHLQVNSFARDRAGHVWACTENGISRWDGDHFTTYGREAGLPARRVLTAYEDPRGRFWVGTASGLALFDGQRFRAWRAADGLVNDFVSALTSSEGMLWIGTAGGISSFDGQTFKNFTTKHGLISQEISSATGLTDRDGSIWFGTAAGAVRYQLVKETPLDAPPRVHLRSVRARDTVMAPPPLLALAHDENNVTLEFQGLSFLDEDAVRYSYRMEGLDADWSEPDRARSVRFMNLAPGRYRFLVKAQSATGHWSAPEALSVEVRPALWQRPAVQALLLLLALGLGFGAYALHARAVEARHRARIDGFRELLDAVRVINSGLDLATVLQNIAAEAAQLVEGEPAGIGLVRGDTVVYERAFVDGAWQTVDRVVPRSEASAAPGVLAVPIANRSGAMVGLLEVRRPPTRAPFTTDDSRLLESLSHQAAIAIENAALYGDLEEKKVELGESLWAVEELYKNERDTTRILQEMNDMKSNFMIVTSHEMRTPLTILKGHLEALGGGFLGALSAGQSGTVDICTRNVERMIASFNLILEMLKIDGRAPLTPLPLHVEDEVEETLAELRAFAERRGQTITVESEPGLPLVVGDSEKIRLVLENLVQNAIKFTPDGGRIRIALCKEGEAVRVSVEDSGVGIDREDLARVFDRFYTSRDSLHHGSGTFQFQARGSGLGLAIAKGYVEAHGGRIWAESAGANRGATFYVLLPVSPGAESEQDALRARVAV